MFTFLTAGESHGRCLTAVIENFPAGVEVAAADVDRDLARRQMGYGRGDRMKIERDACEIFSGVRERKTLGSPISFVVWNRDWVNWEKVMNPEDNDPEQAAGKRITNPRPGHADLSGALKYGHTADVRNVLERASARETAARVGVGAFARALLRHFGISVCSHVIALGEVEAPAWSPESGTGLSRISELADRSQVRCLDKEAESRMIGRIERAKEEKDTLGGVFEVVVGGVPPGLGSYTNWDRRLDARLVRALVSIPAVKGAEVGPAFDNAHKPGSHVHDEIFLRRAGEPMSGHPGPFYRKTNRAGGTEGGMSNGEPIILRAAKKPIPTLMKPLWTVDLSTGEPVQASTERSDVCSLPAASVVGEAVVAIEIARAFLESFGGSNLLDIDANYRHYLKRISGGHER
ncbi:MAG: chorismate synthase [Candidatus Glassbacteria bacterium]|nr:chorismate synthase [Candidatus Glassbacteria bacterium]